MRTPAVTWVMAFALVSFLVVRAVVQAETSGGFDMILRHGTVLDGTGGPPPYKADLGILGGVIAQIGDLRGERALVDLDVTDLVLAPGVINLHSHSAADALPRAENLLTQGVTTVILNSDGRGPEDISTQLAGIGRQGLAVNVGAYIGFNSVWQAVMDLQDRRPAVADIDRMRSLIVRGLEHGAWGVSAGLEYVPAYYAKTEEVVRVVGAAAQWRTNFPNHERITPESNFSAAAGIMETMAIAEATSLVAVITHMKAGALVEKMEDATKRGHYTAADAYPYLAGARRDHAGVRRVPRRSHRASRRKEKSARDHPVRRRKQPREDPPTSDDVDRLRLRRDDEHVDSSAILRNVSACPRPLSTRA